jgi:hypothetical protein
MSIEPKKGNMSNSGLWLVRIECEPGQEEDFLGWYDQIHLPEVLRVDGICAATRFSLVDERGESSGPGWLVVCELDRDVEAVKANLDADRPNRSTHPALVKEAVVSEFFRPEGDRHVG